MGQTTWFETHPMCLKYEPSRFTFFYLYAPSKCVQVCFKVHVQVDASHEKFSELFMDALAKQLKAAGV